jgi:hypothetical protein
LTDYDFDAKRFDIASCRFSIPFSAAKTRKT